MVALTDALSSFAHLSVTCNVCYAIVTRSFEVLELIIFRDKLQECCLTPNINNLSLTTIFDCSIYLSNLEIAGFSPAKTTSVSPRT